MLKGRIRTLAVTGSTTVAAALIALSAWAADWRDAHERLEDLMTRVGGGPWAEGLARVTSDDREIVTRLLTGDLDR